MEFLGGQYGSVVVCGANDTMGTWTSIGTASADFTSLRLQITNQSLNNVRIMLSIRVGGSTTVIENLIFGGRGTIGVEAQSLDIPIGGSSGDAVEVRGQTDNGVDVDLTVAFQLTDQDPCGEGSFVGTYGVDTANTQGKVMDPGAVIDTETKFELTDSGGIGAEARLLAFSFFAPSTAQADDAWKVRVYTGATGATDTGIAAVIRAGANTDNVSDAFHAFFVDRANFPSGTRVWLGVAANTVDAADRILEGALHVFDVPDPAGGATGVPVGRIISGGV